MFYIESYITPIILSYADKYIKNFKLEDSTVSLWDGDACFHNLDLRLEVLEQELHLPVSFVSGHIRELLIHVPWTKLASESITITINTIECILKLRGSDTSSTSFSPGPKVQSHKVETIPGYINSLVQKIVTNIKVICNNLILKYVEEDIVLSMNIKQCKFESANELWESSFIDSSLDNVQLRKLICINDLTICLDKRNAAGKIQVYQEPLLYRCSMTMHLLRTLYSSPSSTKTLITRLDVYCNSLEFGMSEQQLPMLIRLVLIIDALRKKKKEDLHESNIANLTIETKDETDQNNTWSNWAWSYVSSVLDESTVPESTNQKNQGQIFETGFYIDKASVIFKVTDSNNDKNIYTHKKLRYMPILALELQGIYSETMIKPPGWSNSTFGISEILLSPLGHCCCSIVETPEGSKPRPYLRIGNRSYCYNFNSLFDADAQERKEKFFISDWNLHLATLTESVLFERTPAFAVDFLYEMDISNDITPETLSELVSNMEYSNIAERDYTRVFISPLKLRVCSGLHHRVSSLIMAALTHEYVLYFTSNPDPDYKELLPPSVEDFEALTNFQPLTTIKITLNSPIIEFETADHPYFVPKKGKLYKRHKKLSSTQLSTLATQAKEPESAKLIVEFQSIDLTYTTPFYVNRLVFTTCQLPDPPKKLFDACFKKLELKIFGLTSRVIPNAKSQTTVLMPFNAFFMTRQILKPQYWTDPDVTHAEITFEAENLTLNGTKAKTMVISDIIMGLLQLHHDDLSNTSLLVDACNDEGFPYMELYVEGIRFKKVETCSTITLDMSLESVKAFIFETCTNQNNSSKKKEIQQILFISGPETKNEKSSFKESPLFIATIQYPIKPDVQTHPTLITYNLQEIRICVDPLVFKWFLYTPKIFKTDTFSIFSDNLYKIKSTESSLFHETSRKHSLNLESVHSSSDREKSSIVSKKIKIQKEEPLDVQKRIYNFLRDWFPVWKCMIISGEINQCIIYFPMVSLSAVGSRGIQEAVDQVINGKNPPDMMIINLPFLSTHCTQRQPIKKFITQLPVKLPETIWSPERSCFPWTLSIEDLCCYTIQSGEKMDFLKPCSLNATIGLSTKNQKTENKVDCTTSVAKDEISSLGLCVHIDITPVFISTNETQVCLFASILYGLAEVCSSLLPKTKPVVQEQQPARILESIDSKSESIFMGHENSFESLQSSSIIQPEIIEDEAKLTAWLQCTITRCTLELNSSSKKNQPKLKLVIDTEDIVSSIDFQNIYLKMKSKVGSISVEHYKFVKDKWQSGPYLGLVLRHRDDFISEERHEDNAFLNITVTRANCQQTHTLWGILHNKKREKPSLINIPPSRYITELVVSIKPTDILLSFKTLRSFYLVLEPLFAIQFPKKRNRTARSFLIVTNQILPLAYLDCHDIRVVIPSNEKNEKFNHDVFVLHVGKISLTPNAINPICRTPYRPDIYQRAARNRILNIPGSEVEDRQYQLDIIGTSLNTSTWKNVELILNQPTGILTSLHGTSENPAVEWNNLEKISMNTVNPSMHLWPILEKIDVSVVIAPAIVYKDVLICCTSVEMNISSDIFISICLPQIELASSLLSEFSEFAQPVHSSKSKIKLPYTVTTLETPIEHDALKDSGIESVYSCLKPDNFSKREIDKQWFVLGQELEFLLTGGSINLSLYDLAANFNKTNNDIAEKTKEDDSSKLKKTASKHFLLADKHQESEISDDFIPLMFIALSQPNFYVLDEKAARKINFCLFKSTIKTCSKKTGPTSTIPMEKDYDVTILDTLCGTPKPETGIPPAFLSIKMIRSVHSTLDVEFDRPTRIELSRKVCEDLLQIQKKIMECFNSEFRATPTPKKKIMLPLTLIPESSENYVKFQEMKDALLGVTSINVRTNQLVFTWSAKQNNCKMSLTIRKLTNNLSLLNRPDKICNILNVDCLSLLYQIENVSHLIMNPWNISLDSTFFWESWQYLQDFPQVQVIVTSDNFMLNVSAERIEVLTIIINDILDFINDFKELFSSSDEICVVEREQSIVQDIEQHYKDDLRAGAFQFVDSATNDINEMPLPYQVMFWNKNLAAMAWKYPQPRCLTKVRVYPVPLKVATELDKEIELKCNLEYWSDCHQTFINYITFVLPENEILHLDLLFGKSHPPFASIWRVTLTISKTKEDIDLFSTFSPKTFAACMRVDSYFNRNLVPNFTLGFSIAKVKLSLYTHFNKEKYNILPPFLKGYTPDLLFPSQQCFSEIVLDNLKAFGWMWGTDFRIDTYTSFLFKVLDLSFLTMQNMIESPGCRMEASTAKSCNLNFISEQISLNLSPSIAHTLAVSLQLWNVNETEWSKDKKDLDLILITRYVICNDTNIPLKFGQNNTDEEILLMPKVFNMYCWRSNKHKQELRVSSEKNNWVWSIPFSLKPGTRVIEIIDKKRFTLNLTVTALSAAQYQVTFSGHLIIANMLMENFEMKIIQEDKQENKKIMTQLVAGNSTTASIVLNCEDTFFLRLRFYGLESSWTGDIPLREHSKNTQPWLVKVPLLEKGQFLSIWCRVVLEEIPHGKKVLAMLWPLYTIKSNLPINTVVHIDTPTLKYHGEMMAQGRGVMQQLHCPGTIDHSHQLNVEAPASNTFFPLDYTLVDQEKFFQNMDKIEIKDILESLKTYKEVKWPYLGEDFKNFNWIIGEQPETHVQVKYCNSSPYSSSLMIEFSPWCLLMNTLGCTIGIKLGNDEVCVLPHNGILAPPNIENIFNIIVHLDGKKFVSDPFQFAKIANWSKSFYMPKFLGVIPTDGTAVTNVKCDKHICRLSLRSYIANDMRLLRVSSTHVISNYTGFDIKVICLAVPNEEHRLKISNYSQCEIITIHAGVQEKKQGESIKKWNILGADDEPNQINDYAFYMTLSLTPKLGWSKPIRVDELFVRKTTNVISQTDAVPLVLTSYEHKNQNFIGIHHDSRPQIYIENYSGITLYCAQFREGNEPDVYKETEHFEWYCEIKNFGSNYYNMPGFIEKFPDISSTALQENLVFAKEPYNSSWSFPVNISDDIDQYIKIPHYEDVRIKVKNASCLTYIRIESASRVEINAKDIRIRLMEVEEISKMKDAKSHKNRTEITQSLSAEALRSGEDASQKKFTSMQDIKMKQVPIKVRASEPQIPSNRRRKVKFSCPTIPMKETWISMKLKIFVNEFTFTFLSDIQNDSSEIYGIAAVIFDNVALSAIQTDVMETDLYIQNIQIDNQLYSRTNYDFPVLMLMQKPRKCEKINSLTLSMEPLFEGIHGNSALRLNLILDTWIDTSKEKMSGIQKLYFKLEPFCAYVEDTYLLAISDYFNAFLPTNLVVIPETSQVTLVTKRSNQVYIPEIVKWQSSFQAKPLTIRNLQLEQISMLLSVHSSIKMYLALDQSPLTFVEFERKRVYTNAYRLGHTLTMHYLSGAIFRAGWMVSSLEILGSPVGLARAMTSGLKDFVAMPFRGILQGPVEFIYGVTHGTSSLMRHITAGTLQSFTKMASSVARNLDYLTLDDEHVRRTDEQRRQRPAGVTEGIVQGLTGLGISILGAIGGIAHHPLQSVISEGGSPRSLAAGLGLGIVGIITKPLSAAAELLALTGQGLLQGAGWYNLPQQRKKPFCSDISLNENSILKYEWKITSLPNRDNKFLCKTDATSLSTDACYNSVSLILTNKSLIIVNTDEDIIEKTISLSELELSKTKDDCTMFSFELVPKQESVMKVDDDLNIEMDPASRARVADYVKNTVGLLQVNTSREPSEMSISPLSSPGGEKNENEKNNTVFTFYVDPQDKTYLSCLFSMAKEEHSSACHNYPTF